MALRYRRSQGQGVRIEDGNGLSIEIRLNFTGNRRAVMRIKGTEGKVIRLVDDRQDETNGIDNCLPERK